MERLAIEGGVPVRDELLPYGHQWIDDEDAAAVVEALKSDWITQGPKVHEFESKLADYCGTKYAVAVSNGTVALHAACAAAGISSGSEVITTPITFAATANAITYCGGTPVFADVRGDTPNIDPQEIIKRLSSKTRALIPIDFAGHPADLEEIRTIAKERGLVVIEDACHALGAEYKGKKLGSMADMTVFSFHPVKQITTGEGGMIVTDSEEYYHKLRTMRHHGIAMSNLDSEGPWHYAIHQPGFNFRITDFQCALGISQMNKLDYFVQKRSEIAIRYNMAFSGMDEVLLPVVQANVKAANHIYVVQLKLERLKVGRRKIFEALRAENIGVNVHYVPLHLHPFYRDKFGYMRGDYPKAEEYYERAITLPIFPKMNDGDVKDVIDAVNKVITYYRK